MPSVRLRISFKFYKETDVHQKGCIIHTSSKTHVVTKKKKKTYVPTYEACMYSSYDGENLHYVEVGILNGVYCIIDWLNLLNYRLRFMNA